MLPIGSVLSGKPRGNLEVGTLQASTSFHVHLLSSHTKDTDMDHYCSALNMGVSSKFLNQDLVKTMQ